MTAGTTGQCRPRLRERFLAAIAGNVVQPTVCVPDLSYWLTAHPQDWAGDVEAELAFHQDLGVMPYYVYGGSLWRLSWTQITVRSVAMGDGITTTIWDSPWGTLSKETTALPDSATQAVTRYPVSTAEDLGCLIHMLEHAEMLPLPIADYRRRDALFSRFDGYAILSLPRTPLPALLTDWAGVMNGIVLLSDCPDRCQEFFDAAARLCRRGVDIVCDAAPPVVHVCDNLTSDVYTSFYRDLMAPLYREALDSLHQADVKVVTHLDGTTKGLLPLLAASGFDGIEALTPAPVGDISPAQMRELAGPDVVLWGGLPGAMFAPPWCWDELQDHLVQLLDAWHGTPFIVGIADQLPPDGDLEMVRKTAALLEQI